MRIAALIDYFIHPLYFTDKRQLRAARLLVKASFLTSIFSTSYIGLSDFFGFEKGVYLMIFNAIGFMLLPFLLKVHSRVSLVGNLYVAIGAAAVTILTYYSGGMWSGIYPWIISIPILAMLVVNRVSAIIWGIISLIIMIWLGMLAYQGIELPKEYNPEFHIIWYITVLTGLLSIIFFITLVFEMNQRSIVLTLENKNNILKLQKAKIGIQTDQLRDHIEEKDEIIQLLSHDLKNPLANIISLVELMKMEDTKKDFDKYLDMIQQSSTKAHELVIKVLDNGKAEQHKLEVALEEVNIDEQIRDVLDIMWDVADRKNIRIQWESGDDDIVILYAAPQNSGRKSN